MRVSFEYAVIRVVPRVERGEFVNAGVMVFCLSERFLQVKIALDRARLLALWPDADPELIEDHLAAFPRICRGEEDAGPIAAMTVRERFHWLVAPRSTMIQLSPVHSGLCESPETALADLFRRFVAPTERSD